MTKTKEKKRTKSEIITESFWVFENLFSKSDSISNPHGNFIPLLTEKEKYTLTDQDWEKLPKIDWIYDESSSQNEILEYLEVAEKGVILLSKIQTIKSLMSLEKIPFPNKIGLIPEDSELAWFIWAKEELKGMPEKSYFLF